MSEHQYAPPDSGLTPDEWCDYVRLVRASYGWNFGAETKKRWEAIGQRDIPKRLEFLRRFETNRELDRAERQKGVGGC